MSMTPSPLDLAREKARALRESGVQIVRLDPIEKARTNPQSKALAIRAKCWECVGAGHDANPRQEIRDCSVTHCPLHPVRPWQSKPEDDEADA
ncbi:hypothetical protein DKK66_20095 (plasmid) [Aquitalea sp. USM4]|nr:hypothetical protein DKK66_20095 [Aquitalea sp. USM4]